jgi:hypothetical protein
MRCGKAAGLATDGGQQEAHHGDLLGGEVTASKHATLQHDCAPAVQAAIPARKMSGGEAPVAQIDEGVGGEPRGGRLMPPMRPQAMTRRITVTDGDRRPIGSVVARDDGFEALDLDEVSGGVFASEAAAARALWLIARSGWTTIDEAAERVVQRLSASRTGAA